MELAVCTKKGALWNKVIRLKNGKKREGGILVKCVCVVGVAWGLGVADGNTEVVA